MPEELHYARNGEVFRPMNEWPYGNLAPIIPD